MTSQGPFLVARRRPYGIEYLDASGAWTVFLDEAYVYEDRARAERVCHAMCGTLVVSPAFARIWSHVGGQDIAPILPG